MHVLKSITMAYSKAEKNPKHVQNFQGCAGFQDSDKNCIPSELDAND